MEIHLTISSSKLKIDFAQVSSTVHILLFKTVTILASWKMLSCYMNDWKWKHHLNTHHLVRTDNKFAVDILNVHLDQMFVFLTENTLMVVFKTMHRCRVQPQLAEKVPVNAISNFHHSLGFHMKVHSSLVVTKWRCHSNNVSIIRDTNMTQLSCLLESFERLHINFVSNTRGCVSNSNHLLCCQSRSV